MFQNWNNSKTRHMTAVSVHWCISTNLHTCWPSVQWCIKAKIYQRSGYCQKYYWWEILAQRNASLKKYIIFTIEKYACRWGGTNGISIYHKNVSFYWWYWSCWESGISIKIDLANGLSTKRSVDALCISNYIHFNDTFYTSCQGCPTGPAHVCQMTDNWIRSITDKHVRTCSVQIRQKKQGQVCMNKCRWLHFLQEIHLSMQILPIQVQQFKADGFPLQSSTDFLCSWISICSQRHSFRATWWAKINDIS